MPAVRNLDDALLATWRTNNRVTEFFFENLPEPVWSLQVPGAPRRTVRMIAGHIHNCRCQWIKVLGRKFGIPVPKSVNRHSVTRAQLTAAFGRSSEGIVRLIDLGLQRGGKVPGFTQDVVHFVAYFVAHEGHHRGQICVVARQMGHRLSAQTVNGLWDWSKRAREGAVR